MMPMISNEHHPILNGLFALLVVLQFCQVWPEIGGFTFRFETILTSALLVYVLMTRFIHRPYRSFRNKLTMPVLIWIIVLMFGVMHTLLQPFPSGLKKDAIVNGIRLAMSFSTFFVALRYPLSPRKKLKIVLVSIIWFSFFTTTVAVAQIVYHDAWFSIQLPRCLTEHAAGANNERGREIFGLNLGDTSGHSFASFIAIQAACIFYWFGSQNRMFKKMLGVLISIMLLLLIMRVSVRAAFLGFLIGLLSVGLFDSSRKARRKTQYYLKILFMVLLIFGVLLSILEYSSKSYYLERIASIIPKYHNNSITFKGGSNIYGRLFYWKNAEEIFIKSPIIGGGFYSYQELTSRLYHVLIPHAHNSYLQTLAELGLVGILAFILLLWRARRMWKDIVIYQSRDEIFICTRRILLWLLSFLLITMIFANTFYQPQYLSTGCILFGGLVDYVKNNNNPILNNISRNELNLVMQK